jgi:hypothetical protein
LLNLEDAALISTTKGLSLPSVKSHKLIYIPKTESDFKTLLQNAKSNNANFSTYDTDLNKVVLEDPLPSSETMFHLDSSKFNTESQVQVRFLADCELPYDFGVSEKSDS